MGLLTLKNPKINLKENSKTIKSTKENTYGKITKIYMKDIFIIIKCMEKEFILTHQERKIYT